MKGMIGSFGTTGRPSSKRIAVPLVGAVSLSYCPAELVTMAAALAMG
jgi:hypothetical protein